MGLGKTMMQFQPDLTPEILVPRLGDYLVERGTITPEGLQRALDFQAQLRAEGKQPLLGQILLDLGLLDRQTLDQAITEQIMQLRAALQETNRQREQRVQERTAELQNALNKLSELNQLKSNIVANISHELRTPLTHIKGYLELLMAQLMGPLSQEQISALEVMQRSTERLERQIEDLILFSIASRGEFSLRLASKNIASMFDAIIKRSQTKALEKRIELNAQVLPEVGKVKVDEEKFSWALVQLVDNAIKFTQPEGRVTLEAEPTAGMVRLAVIDNGIGIPEDRLPELFEPFHQLDGSSTRRYGGTGLGLSLVRQIIEAHGSSIHVHSAVGQGSRFEFELACDGG
jgi:signal transduction histidine kinase